MKSREAYLDFHWF